MEIRFSKPVGSEVGTVYRLAHGEDVAIKLTSANGPRVRFTLPEADELQHDRVIRALLTLDPDATIRTAKAHYAGLQDFIRQRGTPEERGRLESDKPSGWTMPEYDK